MTSKKIKKRSPKKIVLERKLRDYARFLKDDEDYDYGFIIRMLRFKLERTRDQIVSNKIIKSAPKVGNQIQQVVDLLKKVEADKYFEELHKPFWEKYGKPKMITGKPDERGLSSLTFKYPKETPSNRSQRIREQRQLAVKEHKLRSRDLERAFKLMLKNIWGWWD